MMVTRNKSENGNAMMEFAVVSVVLIPVLFGTVAFGVNLGNMLQCAQITRDVAHMYAEQIDFSQAANQNLAVYLAQGLGGMTVNGGNGVLILSQIREVYQADCTAAGPTLGACTNLGQRVFQNRLIIGNSALRSSDFGAPAAADVTSNGSISAQNYLTHAGDVATGFTDAILPEADNEVAYVVEGYFATPNLSFLGNWDATSSGGTYTRAIF